MTAHPIASGIRSLSRSLETPGDLDPIVARAKGRRFVAIGEASHGTHEFYAWRAELTRRLIVEEEFDWIGVEGDWPDCWRIDRWVRGIERNDLDARGALASFARWPTWMWANAEVADFLDWLRELNETRPPDRRVGFYGLDVYSLWTSLGKVMRWLEHNAPEALPAAHIAWQCFAPFGEDPHEYAWGTRLVPMSCEGEVVDLLLAVRKEAASSAAEDLDVVQNAAVVVGAERYYRAMLASDRTSWNIRDIHMADTVDRVAKHFGSGSRGVLWAHNTHVGDARATSMAAERMLNLGQLLRERHGERHVLLVGFASYSGSVIAAPAWGSPEAAMPVPDARAGSHERILHDTLERDSVLDFAAAPDAGWLQVNAGHRAIGVVYDPAREAGNYVPTRMGGRYDALIWLEHTGALVPVHHEPLPTEPEFETEPTGL